MQPQPTLSLSAREVGNGPAVFCYVAVSGELKEDGVESFHQLISSLLARGQNRIALDATGLAFVSSAGYGRLLHFASRARSRGGDVKIVSASPALLRWMRLLALETRFESCRDASGAAYAFARDARSPMTARPRERVFA